MVCSGAFGRGMGEKKLTRLLTLYPDFLTRIPDYTQAEIQEVDGFAGKTAALIVSGLPRFREFLKQNAITPPVSAVSPIGTGSPLKVCLTGFRDADIKTFIEKNGGTLQTACTKCTDILIIPQVDYTNKKTETAKTLNVRIMTADDFKTQYL